MTKQLYKFNPSLAAPKVLQETLVGREKQLGNILRKIEESGQETSLRHFMIVGQRGSGKTHMLLLIYYTVNGTIQWNGKFGNLKNSWIPVRFAEEEYRITSLGELLLRVAQEAEKEEPSLSGREPSEELSVQVPKHSEAEQMLDLLLEHRKRLGKRLLLLIDNFHDILQRFTAEDRGRLRDILTGKDLFMLIGTAPSLFSQITSYEDTFYNFFENLWLESLSEEQGTNLFIKWREQEGGRLDANGLKELRPRIKALIHLTGGNPRLILGVYSILMENPVLEVEDAFVALLDDLTPYYQSRVKELSPQQAKILDAMALADRPSSPTEIAADTQLEITKITSQLKRMGTAGYVEPLREGRKRRVLYDVTDRLFRLWRQMRVESGRRYLKFLVTIVKVWYSEVEIKRQFEEASSEFERALATGDKAAVDRALKHMWYFREACGSRLKTEMYAMRLAGLVRTSDYDTAQREIEELRSKSANEGDTESLAISHFYEGLMHSKRGDTAEARSALKRGLDLHPGNSAIWYNLGVTFSDESRHQEAIESYKRAVELDPQAREAWYNMGNEYYGLGRHEEAIAAHLKAAELKPDWYEAWTNLGLDYLSVRRYDESLNALQKARTINADRYEVWGALGEVSLQRGRYREAAEAFKKAANTSPSLDWVWARLSMALLFSGDDEHGYEAAGKAVDLNPRDPINWSHLAHALDHLGKYDDAIKAYGEAISISPEEPSLFLNRALTFYDMDATERAIADAKTAVELGRKQNDKELLEAAAEGYSRWNLLTSARNAEKGEVGPAERHFRQSLLHMDLVPADKVRELMTVYLNGLLKAGKIEFLGTALGIMEEGKSLGVESLVRFYRISLAYLKTKDEGLLNQLFPELRELVRGLVQVNAAQPPGERMN
ncbi:MAG: tetratricopeptide repeat protein [Chloroflexi bacterium]|nr:tetratricopeptide repeat protein [Chloroflexota bacterium]